MDAYPLALNLIDGGPPATDLASLAAADLDGDGRMELVTGGGVKGPGALLWYRPSSGEWGLIDEGRFGVGLALEDVDGDGRPEVVAASLEDGKPLYWYRAAGDLGHWRRHLLTDVLPGASHDMLFADFTGDGGRQLLTNAVAQDQPGLWILRPGADVTRPWQAHPLQRDHFEEGLAAGDLTGDGRLEVVAGPNWYAAPQAGALSGPWTRGQVSARLREMCRVGLADITGNGRLDVVIVESEYDDGRLSWFENRLAAGDGQPWREHRLEEGLAFGHSLDVRRDDEGAVRIFVAEMAHGGYGAPPNYDARLLEYVQEDGSAEFVRRLLYQGAGTHEALRLDVDGDGALEIVGKTWRHPKVQSWHTRPAGGAEDALQVEHRFVDRDKPGRAVESLAVDVDGDGQLDVACGALWYAGPHWQRFAIPGISQVVAAYDLDGDGRQELVAVAGDSLSSQLCWLKPIDPRQGVWERHAIGEGTGDWPHGAAVGPLLAGGRAALAVAYHSAVHNPDHHPELFIPPPDPASGPWERRTLAEIQYSEQLVPYDINGSGRTDLVAGTVWLENLGDGEFRVQRFADPDFYAARISVTDVNGSGRPDIVMAEGKVRGGENGVPVARLAWFEHPHTGPGGRWPMHVIDTMRAPHSLGVADLDGDGEPEIVCAEHEIRRPYRTRCRLFLYKKSAGDGRSWYRSTLDHRFEHHCGAQILAMGEGRTGIVSHGWKESRYLHLWTCRPSQLRR